MSRARLLRAVMAVCCIAALGTMAASIDTAVTSGPLEGMEPNWSSLPLTEEEAAELKETLDVRDEIGLEEDMEVNKSDDIETPEQTPPPADINVQGGGVGGPGGGAPPSGPEVVVNDAGSTDESTGPNWWVLVGPLAVATAIALAHRYRTRLGTVLAALSGMTRGLLPAESTTARTTRQLPAYEPEHAVDRAWLRLLRELGLEGRRTVTPAECARAAKAAGMAPEPVETLRRTFEEVRYGGRPVTEERRRRVRDGLRALEIGTVPS